MQLVVIFASVLLLVRGQEIDDETRRRIEEIFPTANNNVSPTPNLNPNSNVNGDGDDWVPDGAEEVTQRNLEGYGPNEKCGEGATKGVKMCVNYDRCDGRTGEIVQTGVTDGFGLIDIRFGTNACSHPLEVCCKIPAGGLNPDLPNPDEPSSERVPVDQGTTPSTVITQTPPVTKPSYCGIRNPNGIDFKITGARDNEAEYGEFPWMVAILNKNAGSGQPEQLICGGSLITPNIVLTGAHCVSKLRNYDIKVRAGEWDTQTTRERLPYQEREVREIRVHPNFNGGNLHNDFAILILQESINQADNVGTICLPPSGLRFNSRNCFVSGWGKREFGRKGKFQAILKKIELPIVDRRTCQNALRTTRLGSKFELDNSFICAGGEQGKDACTGDGGSPLVCPDPNNPNRYMQAGIVAWGIGCGEQNIPGVYGDVSQFRAWIDQELRRLNIDNSPYNL